MADLTKTDRRALFHAVNNAKYMLHAIADDPELTEATKKYERARYEQARKALRKLYAAARQQQEPAKEEP